MRCMTTYSGKMAKIAVSDLHYIAHHIFTFRRRPLVEFRIHTARDAFLVEHLGEFLADVGVFLVIRYGAATLVEINRTVIHELLAGTARLACALIVRAMPG